MPLTPEATQSRSLRSRGREGRLRVGFDGRALTSPAAGIRRYTSELLRAIVALDDAPEIVLLGGADVRAAPSGLEHVSEPWHPPTNLGWMLVGFPEAARRARVDLIHAPAYTAPFFASVPVVLTIHDVSYARHPEWFPYRRDPLRRAFYRRSALSAALVLTVSTFSASEITAAYGIDPATIVVTPHGIDVNAFGAEGGSGPLPDGVAAPYVLHVGDLHTRRNLGVALEAVIAARRAGGALATLSLVLAGVDRGLTEALRAQAATAGVPDAVRPVGLVSDAVLKALYRRASALVYPSLYEGFGMPLFEAMAAGVPVVASSAASVPEVVGDAGLLIDPGDGAAWVDAVHRVLTDTGLAADLRARGLARARTFTWARTARATVQAYHRVLGD